MLYHVSKFGCLVHFEIIELMYLDNVKNLWKFGQRGKPKENMGNPGKNGNPGKTWNMGNPGEEREPWENVGNL